MTQDISLPAPFEDCRLRPQTPEDGEFLLALFDASAGAQFRLSGLPEPMIANLVQMQHRSRTQTYGALYPDGPFLILERGGQPVGRLALGDLSGSLHIVDIAIAPGQQKRGLASALLAYAIDSAAERGLGVTAEITLDNTASFALFDRMGFTRGDPEDGAHVPVSRPFQPA